MLKFVRPPPARAVGAEEFRSALARFASGVTVITSLDSNGAAHGMTATAFSSLSLDPPLVLVAVTRESRCYRQVHATQRFGVSILRDDQSALSRHFGRRNGTGLSPTFEDLEGLPVIDDAMVKLACELDSTANGGDHTILVGRVTATRQADGEPLIHYNAAYRKLSKDII